MAQKAGSVIIYGAGVAGRRLCGRLLDSGSEKVLCFIDDDRSLSGQQFRGIPIFRLADIERIAGDASIFYLAIPSCTTSERQKILASISVYNKIVLEVPSIADLMAGSPIDNLSPPRNIIGRHERILTDYQRSSAFTSRSFCILGGAGSIGAEIASQLTLSGAKSVTIVDSNELGLYNVERQIGADGHNLLTAEVNYVLGNAADQAFLEKIYEDYEIDSVINAAAYKHVAIVEKNPLACIRNNVLSAHASMSAARNTNVRNYVYISTDKAVRPTSLMGATKRCSERLIYSMGLAHENSKSSLISTAVRFGNVLNSSGSVMHLFQKQIEKGGPITVTHPEVCRYFMSIQEAVSLTLSTLCMGKGGEVYLLRMGEPVLIYDLACKLIELNGLSGPKQKPENPDINIEYIGLNPGEKLNEELLVSQSALHTNHPSIFQEQIDSDPLSDQAISEFVSIISESDEVESLAMLKQLVPEWQPSNMISDILRLSQ